MMIDPRIKTPTHMSEDPPIWSGRIAYPKTLGPLSRRGSVPQLGLRSPVRYALTAVFSRLADIRSQKSGSLREEIARVAPFANNYDEPEDPADE